MKYVYLTLNWIFGVLFLLLGLVSLVNDLLTALPSLVISLFLLPPVRKFAYSKTNKEVPFKARAGAIFVLVVLFLVFMGQSANRELQKFANQQAQNQQAQTEKHLAYFHANKSIILAEIQSAIEAKEYQKAISLSSKYLVVGNEELLALNGRAKEELATAHKAEETEKLLYTRII
ncbi:MAG: hypothetical protein HC877_19425 [Thioploca sp.]|nr:hypothetical protein [Thioploca sp.]